MIDRVETVCVFVADQDRAKRFYTNTLGTDLKAKGVKFTQEPDPQPWGAYATIEDSEGNRLILVEEPRG
jgi:predicted enzyme related to lactoylglutathione lyase